MNDIFLFSISNLGINSKFCFNMTSIVKHRAAIALIVAIVLNFSDVSIAVTF